MFNNTSNFNSLVDAMNLKIAVLQAQEHMHPHLLRESPTAGEMIFGKDYNKDQELPVFDENKGVFAGSLIQNKDHAPTVPSSIRLGTVIRYDSGGELPVYGVVTPPPPFTTDKGVYVQKISASEVSDLKERNHHQVEVKIGATNLKNIHRLRKSIVRSRRSVSFWRFIHGQPGGFFYGVSLVEFLMTFVIFAVFFVSFGVLLILFF